MVTAATLVCGYRKRLVRLDDERLAKQAFLRSLELGRMAAGQREATAPWVGQVHSFLMAAHIACDMVHPCEVGCQSDCHGVGMPSPGLRAESKGTAVRERCWHPGQAMLHHRSVVSICRWSPSGKHASGRPSCATDRTGLERRQAVGQCSPALMHIMSVLLWLNLQALGVGGRLLRAAQLS